MNFNYKIVEVSFRILLIHCLLLPWWGFATVEWSSKDISIKAPVNAEVVEFRFAFKNTGLSVLEFNPPAASCGCTLAKWDKLVYAPGEEGLLTGTYSAKGRLGLNTVSIIVSGAEILSGVRKSFSEKLSLSVSVPELVKISPSILLWKRGSEGVARVISLVVNDEYSVKLGISKSVYSGFNVRLNELKEGRAYELTVNPASTSELQQVPIVIDGIAVDGRKLKFYVYMIVR